MGFDFKKLGSAGGCSATAKAGGYNQGTTFAASAKSGNSGVEQKDLRGGTAKSTSGYNQGPTFAASAKSGNGGNGGALKPANAKAGSGYNQGNQFGANSK